MKRSFRTAAASWRSRGPQARGRSPPPRRQPPRPPPRDREWPASTAAARRYGRTGQNGTRRPPRRRPSARHVTTNSFSSYRSVTASDQSHAWAVGGTGVAGYGSPIAAHWHQGRWSASAMPSRAVGSVVAVSADGPRDAWAVTVGNVLHWHTGRWTIAKSFSLEGGPPGFQPTGITALSPTDVWVFGGTGHWAGRGTWHLHGHTWTKVAGAGHNIFEASAPSPRSTWAIAGRNGDSILRYANGRG